MPKKPTICTSKECPAKGRCRRHKNNAPAIPRATEKNHDAGRGEAPTCGYYIDPKTTATPWADNA